MKLQIGDLIEIVTFDHTSDDTVEGWREPKDVIHEPPFELRVAGYYVGEDDKTIKIAMARAGSTFSTFWYVLKNPNMTITKRREKKNDEAIRQRVRVQEIARRGRDHASRIRPRLHDRRGS